MKRNNQKGFITIDFIFAMTMAFGFAAIFFSLTFALSIVEVTQYVTFASARTYFGANLDPGAQANSGLAKFEELRNNPVIRHFYENGWFEIGEPEFRDHGETYGYQPMLKNDSSLFQGARVSLVLRILAIDWPLIGSTGDAQQFETHLTAFLGREPTLAECQSFTAARFAAIRQLDSRFNAIPGNADYYLMMDNGC